MARKIGCSIVGLLFLLFAYFQWNDPDGLKWIFYYLIVSLLSFATAFKKNKELYIYITIVATFIWMTFLLPGTIAWIRDGMPTIVESMKASSPYIELVREFLGLLIALITLLSLLLVEIKFHNKKEEVL
ncbi:transmembrane 220 family protein [Portibacter marinus]|uniref:transmembrane 220 family protein n=1 Tax=Portibacter marinus TaxID=2898660 RepID=UPI001F16E242|nr:transmembrane 220 family protein [Portibacter marinus]